MCSQEFHIKLSSVVQDRMAALPPLRRGLVESVIREIKTRVAEGASHDSYKDSLLDGLPGADEYKIYYRFGVSIVYVIDSFKIFIDNIEITTPPGGGSAPRGVPRSSTPEMEFFDHARARVYWIATNMLVYQRDLTCHSSVTGGSDILLITNSEAGTLQLALKPEPLATPAVSTAAARQPSSSSFTEPSSGSIAGSAHRALFVSSAYRPSSSRQEQIDGVIWSARSSSTGAISGGTSGRSITELIPESQILIGDIGSDYPDYSLSDRVRDRSTTSLRLPLANAPTAPAAGPKLGPLTSNASQPGRASPHASVTIDRCLLSAWNGDRVDLNSLW